MFIDLKVQKKKGQNEKKKLRYRTLEAYLRVLTVSPTLLSDGDTHAITAVALLPPRESLN